MNYSKTPEKVLRPEVQEKLSPYVPFYQESMLYTNGLKPFVYPYEFTGWKDEQLSWEKTCYIHGGLNPSPTTRFSGKDAKAFLSKYCVNTFLKFPVGSAKHCISCNEDGTISGDGVILRTKEDEYVTYWMYSLICLAASEGAKYDMEVTDLTNDLFLFQVAGPKSLQVLEKVTGDDLHDIRFMKFRNTSINGKEFRICRCGMAQTLAYELHGDIQDAREIYDAIYEAGKEFGIRRLGWHTYMMQHTLDGIPQFGYHWNIKMPGVPASPMKGSYSQETEGYVNPLELGWGFTVKFDHDFVGRKALEEYAANPKRTCVSLEWNKEDILDVYASQFEDGEPYQSMEEPNDMYYDGLTILHQDKVLNEKGEAIGFSAGRMYSVYYRRMVSLCVLDLPYAAEGTEVFVLWGEPGTRQKKIRAKVSRMPYFNENPNQKFDVETIPHIK